MKKPSFLAILGEKSSNSENEVHSRLEEKEAKALLSAVSADDPKALVEAFRKLYQLVCDMPEEEEEEEY